VGARQRLNGLGIALKIDMIALLTEKEEPDE